MENLTLKAVKNGLRTTLQLNGSTPSALLPLSDAILGRPQYYYPSTKPVDVIYTGSVTRRTFAVPGLE